jgi:hypothetical protein
MIMKLIRMEILLPVYIVFSDKFMQNITVTVISNVCESPSTSQWKSFLLDKTYQINIENPSKGDKCDFEVITIVSDEGQYYPIY